MGRKPNTYNLIIGILQELHTKYPSFGMARHISTALDGYRDIWGVPDKELLFALEKYKLTIELDETPITEGKELSKIMEDAMHLDSILEDNEEIEPSDIY